MPARPSRFPFSRPELLKEWVLNIGRANFKPKKHTVICSEHFSPECFSAFGNRKNLKHNAVPTVFAFQDPTQLVRENTDPGGESSEPRLQKGKVPPEAGPAELGAGRSVGAALEELQLPANAEGPRSPGWPQRPDAAEGPGRAGRPLPRQPSDHSYALLDLDALKTKLSVTLKENEKLRRRLKAQRLVMRRMRSRLRAHGAGPRGLRGPRAAGQPAPRS